MKVDRLTIRQIRTHTVFGAGDAAYIDGSACPKVDPGLHRILGVYDVDVYNALKYDDSNAWKLVLSNGYIRT